MQEWMNFALHDRTEHFIVIPTVSEQGPNREELQNML